MTYLYSRVVLSKRSVVSNRVAAFHIGKSEALVNMVSPLLGFQLPSYGVDPVSLTTWPGIVLLHMTLNRSGIFVLCLCANFEFSILLLSLIHI